MDYIRDWMVTRESTVRKKQAMAEQPPKTRLQAERMKRQWTQQEVADKIGVPVKTLSRWEGGGQNAGPHNLKALSEVFGERVDGSWLQRLEDTAPPSNVPYDSIPSIQIKGTWCSASASD